MIYKYNTLRANTKELSLRKNKIKNNLIKYVIMSMNIPRQLLLMIVSFATAEGKSDVTKLKQCFYRRIFRLFTKHHSRPQLHRYNMVTFHVIEQRFLLSP